MMHGQRNIRLSVTMTAGRTPSRPQCVPDTQDQEGGTTLIYSEGVTQESKPKRPLALRV